MSIRARMSEVMARMRDRDTAGIFGRIILKLFAELGFQALMGGVAQGFGKILVYGVGQTLG